MIDARRSTLGRNYSRSTLQAVELLGKLVRAARIERGWPVQELAERAGVSRDLIQRIEQGDPRAGIGTAFEAASLVGVALFEEEPGRLGRRIAEHDARLRLLPRAVHRKKRDVADDF